MMMMIMMVMMMIMVIILTLLVMMMMMMMMINIIMKIVIIIALKDPISSLLRELSLTVRSSGQDPFVCKSRATHRELITCNMSCVT